MKISIVLNTFNNINQLRTILSQFKLIQNSRKKNLFFFTIIDDSSSDGTFQEIQKFININKLQIEHLLTNSENIGISESRNKAIKLNFDKDYLLFIDGDDYLDLSNFLKIDFLKFNSDLICFNFTYKNISNEKYKINTFYKSKKIINKNEKISYFVKYMEKPNRMSLFTTCWAKFYRVNFLKTHNIFFNKHLKLCEDTYFVFRILNLNSKVEYFPNPFYIHTISDGIENLNKLTFGVNFDLKHQLSFIKPSKSVWFYLLSNKVFDKNLLRKKFNHLITSYFIIYSIRSMLRSNSLCKFFINYFFWRSVYSKNIFRNALGDYSVIKARGNKILYFLLKWKMFFLFILYAFMISKRRYMKK